MDQRDYKLTKTCNDYMIKNSCEWLMNYSIMKNREEKELKDYKYQRWFSYTADNVNIIRVADEFDLLVKEYSINVHQSDKKVDIVLYGDTFMLYSEFRDLEI